MALVRPWFLSSYTLYGCKDCDFDVCRACRAKGRAPTANTPAPTTSPLTLEHACAHGDGHGRPHVVHSAAGQAPSRTAEPRRPLPVAAKAHLPHIGSMPGAASSSARGSSGPHSDPRRVPAASVPTATAVPPTPTETPLRGQLRTLPMEPGAATHASHATHATHAIVRPRAAVAAGVAHARPGAEVPQHDTRAPQAQVQDQTQRWGKSRAESALAAEKARRDEAAEQRKLQQTWERESQAALQAAAAVDAEKMCTVTGRRLVCTNANLVQVPASFGVAHGGDILRMDLSFNCLASLRGILTFTLLVDLVLDNNKLDHTMDLVSAAPTHRQGCSCCCTTKRWAQCVRHEGPRRGCMGGVARGRAECSCSSRALSC